MFEDPLLDEADKMTIAGASHMTVEELQALIKKYASVLNKKAKQVKWRVDEREKCLETTQILCDVLRGKGGAIPKEATLIREEMTEVVIALQSKSRPLRHIAFHFTKVEAREMVMLAIPLTAHFHNVNVLALNDHNIGSQGAEALGSMLVSNRSIQTILLSQNMIGDDGLKSLVEGLRGNHVVATLGLSDNDIHASGVQALSFSFRDTCITHLDLARNPISDEGAVLIAKFLPNTLIVLDLSDCGVGLEGAKAIATALESNVTLTRLYLDGNQVSVSGGSVLACALCNHPSMVEFSLANCEIRDEGAVSFGEVLGKSKSIQMLCLDGNNIGPVGAMAVAQGLEGKNVLTHLEMSENPIGDKGVTSIVKALAKNTCLCVLTLNFTNMGDEGAKCVGEMMAINTNISTLCLSGNAIGNVGAQALAQGLKKNKCLDGLGVAGNHIGQEGSAAFAQMFADNYCLCGLFGIAGDFDEFLGRNNARKRSLVNAVSSGDLVEVKELLEAGVSKGFVYHGLTIFHLALDARTADILGELLKNNRGEGFVKQDGLRPGRKSAAIETQRMVKSNVRVLMSNWKVDRNSEILSPGMLGYVPKDVMKMIAKKMFKSLNLPTEHIK